MFGFVLEYYSPIYPSVNETPLKRNSFSWFFQVSFKRSRLYKALVTIARVLVSGAKNNNTITRCVVL